ERAARARRAGTPGPEGSTAKLHWADLNKRIYSFCVDLMGPEGMLYPEGYGFRVPDETAMGRRSPQMNSLRARANSIEGGTSETTRNILGERVLGLPGEPRMDKDLPWREVTRGCRPAYSSPIACRPAPTPPWTRRGRCGRAPAPCLGRNCWGRLPRSRVSCACSSTPSMPS